MIGSKISTLFYQLFRLTEESASEGNKSDNQNAKVFSTILSVILFDLFWYCGDCYTGAFFFFPTS